jgi:hypothetical protein
VHFTAEGELKGLMEMLGPATPRLLARPFAAYHRNLRQNAELSHDRQRQPRRALLVNRLPRGTARRTIDADRDTEQL